MILFNTLLIHHLASGVDRLTIIAENSTSPVYFRLPFLNVDLVECAGRLCPKSLLNPSSLSPGYLTIHSNLSPPRQPWTQPGHLKQQPCGVDWILCLVLELVKEGNPTPCFYPSSDRESHFSLECFQLVVWWYWKWKVHTIQSCILQSIELFFLLIKPVKLL